MSTKIDYLGWASFILTSPLGVRVITDPFLAGDPQLLIPPSPVDAKDIVVDLIIASHCANDHFAQAMQIMSNAGHTKILGDHATMCMTEKAGYGNTFGPRAELTTGGATYVQDDFKIRAVDARHISFTHFPDGTYMTGEPLCYIIQIENGPTCFFGGDTSLTMDMKLWGDLYHPDIAFVGIGGADIKGRSLDEMDPEEAARCVEMLGAKIAIPMHYRTQEHLERFRHYLAVRAPKCQCLAMKAGESFTYN